MDEARLAELIARARNRDADAFDTLVEAYGPRLFGFFYRTCGRHDEAEDLLQETFLRVVRMIGGYEHDGRFDRWLFRIATNLVRDRVRRMRRSPVVGIMDESVAEPVSRTAPGPDARIEQAEAWDRLQSALQRLPPAERDVVLLRHFSELPFKEIAELTGTPIGTALARAHRGLRKLRKWMDESG